MATFLTYSLLRSSPRPAPPPSGEQIRRDRPEATQDEGQPGGMGRNPPGFPSPLYIVRPQISSDTEKTPLPEKNRERGPLDPVLADARVRHGLIALLFVAAFINVLAGYEEAARACGLTSLVLFAIEALGVRLDGPRVFRLVSGAARDHEFDIPGFPDDRSEKRPVDEAVAAGVRGVPTPDERESVVGGLVDEVPDEPPMVPPRPREEPAVLSPELGHNTIWDGQRVTCRKPGCQFEYTTFKKGEGDVIASAHSAYPRLSIDEALRLYEEDRNARRETIDQEFRDDEEAEALIDATREMPMGPIYPQTPRAAEERAEEGFPEGTRVYVEKYDQRGTVIPFDGIVGGLNPQIIYVAVKLDSGPTYAIDIRDLVRVEDLERPDENRGQEFHRQAKAMAGQFCRDCGAVLGEPHKDSCHSTGPVSEHMVYELEQHAEFVRQCTCDRRGPIISFMPGNHHHSGCPLRRDDSMLAYPDPLEDGTVVHIDLGRMTIVGPAPFERPGVIDLPASGALSGYIGVHGKPVIDSQVHGNHLAEAIRLDQMNRAVLSQEVTQALGAKVGEREALLRLAQPHILERRDAAMEAVEPDDDEAVAHTDALVQLAEDIAEVLGTAAEDKYERASDFPPDGPETTDDPEEG